MRRPRSWKASRFSCFRAFCWGDHNLLRDCCHMCGGLINIALFLERGVAVNVHVLRSVMPLDSSLIGLSVLGVKWDRQQRKRLGVSPSIPEKQFFASSNLISEKIIMGLEMQSERLINSNQWKPLFLLWGYFQNIIAFQTQRVPVLVFVCKIFSQVIKIMVLCRPELAMGESQQLYPSSNHI